MTLEKIFYACLLIVSGALRGMAQPSSETITLTGRLEEPVRISVAGQVLTTGSLPFKITLRQVDIPARISITSPNYEYRSITVPKIDKKEYRIARQTGEPVCRTYIVAFQKKTGGGGADAASPSGTAASARPAALGLGQLFNVAVRGEDLYFKVTDAAKREVDIVARPDGKYGQTRYEIPSEVAFEGTAYTVTGIGEQAFFKCKELSAVVLPPTIRTIGESAFGYCRNLKNVEFPQGLEMISASAFCGASLEKVILPNTVKSIGEMAFFSAQAIRGIGGSDLLATISVPKSVQTIGKHAFTKFGNGLVWAKNKCQVLSLPDWVTSDNVGELGIHEDSFSEYRMRAQNESPAYQPEAGAELAQASPDLLTRTDGAGAANSPVPASAAAPSVPALASAEPPSDADTDIPVTGKRNDNTFAVIIGNENYTQAVKVAFAQNDAGTFARYCRNTLGLPETNIRSYKDATFGVMLAAIKDMQAIAEAYGGEARFIFYYAGHGVPDEEGTDAFLLPVDVAASSTEACYPLSRLYKELGEMKAASTLVFLDACFSGSQRGEGMLASARGVAIKPKMAQPVRNLVVFSAASGQETAYPYQEKRHGLFTYFLLKKLQETKGDVSLGELAEFISAKVKQRSIVVNRKSQSPAVQAPPAMGSDWRNLKLM